VSAGLVASNRQPLAMEGEAASEGTFLDTGQGGLRISVIPYTQFGVFEREVSEAA
jgi:hypothetical protein